MPLCYHTTAVLFQFNSSLRVQNLLNFSTENTGRDLTLNRSIKAMMMRSAARFSCSKLFDDDSKVSASFLCQNEDCGVQVCAVDKALPSVMTKAEFEADVFAVGVFSSIAEVDWYKRVVG